MNNNSEIMSNEMMNSIDVVLNEHVSTEKQQVKEFVKENTNKRKSVNGEETLPQKKYKWYQDPNYQNQAAYFILDDDV